MEKKRLERFLAQKNKVNGLLFDLLERERSETFIDQNFEGYIDAKTLGKKPIYEKEGLSFDDERKTVLGEIEKIKGLAGSILLEMRQNYFDGSEEEFLNYCDFFGTSFREVIDNVADRLDGTKYDLLVSTELTESEEEEKSKLSVSLAYHLSHSYQITAIDLAAHYYAVLQNYNQNLSRDFFNLYQSRRFQNSLKVDDTEKPSYFGYFLFHYYWSKFSKDSSKKITLTNAKTIAATYDIIPNQLLKQVRKYGVDEPKFVPGKFSSIKEFAKQYELILPMLEKVCEPAFREVEKKLKRIKNQYPIYFPEN